MQELAGILFILKHGVDVLTVLEVRARQGPAGTDEPIHLPDRLHWIARIRDRKPRPGFQRIHCCLQISASILQEGRSISCRCWVRLSADNSSASASIVTAFRSSASSCVLIDRTFDAVEDEMGCAG